MLVILATPILFSLLAVGLTLAAVRGRWFVFRVVIGAVAFVATIIAAVGWIISAWMVLAPLPGDSEAQPYIGWDPRGLRGWSGLFLVLLFAAYMALVLWAGHRRQQRRLQGKT